jgi:hypothetical protein
MSLNSRIEELSQLLLTNPGIEDEPSLIEARWILTQAIDRMLEDHRALLGRQKVLELDLIAGITNARKNTAEWLTAHSPGNRQYLRATRVELEEFAREATTHRIAEHLINELVGERDRGVKALYALVDLDDTAISIRLKEMEDDEMIRFCEGNEIRVSRTAKNPFNRTRTIANIRRRITELKEYMKLSRLE